MTFSAVTGDAGLVGEPAGAGTAATAVAPAHDAFTRRHIGTDAVAQRTMLDALGYATVESLVEAAVPASIHVAPRTTSDIPPVSNARLSTAGLVPGKLVGANASAMNAIEPAGRYAPSRPL